MKCHDQVLENFLQKLIFIAAYSKKKKQKGIKMKLESRKFCQFKKKKVCQ